MAKPKERGQGRGLHSQRCRDRKAIGQHFLGTCGNFTERESRHGGPHSCPREGPKGVKRPQRREIGGVVRCLGLRNENSESRMSVSHLPQGTCKSQVLWERGCRRSCHCHCPWVPFPISVCSVPSFLLLFFNSLQLPLSLEDCPGAPSSAWEFVLHTPRRASP